MKIRKVYKHRGYVIIPSENRKWFVMEFEPEFNTLKECRSYIDNRLGGWATNRKPKRLDD